MKLAINAEGTDRQDLIDAVEEVTRLLEGGFTSGMDRNETGAFKFQVEEATP